MLLHPHGNQTGAIPKQAVLLYNPLCASGKLSVLELPCICNIFEGFCSTQTSNEENQDQNNNTSEKVSVFSRLNEP